MLIRYLVHIIPQDNKLNQQKRCRNDKIRAIAIGILTHKNGTDTEDLYLIDGNTGDIILKKLGKLNGLGVTLSNEEANYIRELDNVIAIHNHPTNVFPTGADFATSGYRGYEFGIVITHDGSVYKYKHGAVAFLSRIYDDRVEKYQKYPYNLSIKEAYLRVLKEFREEYGIEWQVRK